MCERGAAVLQVSQAGLVVDSERFESVSSRAWDRLFLACGASADAVAVLVLPRALGMGSAPAGDRSTAHMQALAQQNG